MSENESNGQSDSPAEGPEPSSGFELGPPEGQRSARGGMTPFAQPEVAAETTDLEDSAIVIAPDDLPAPVELYSELEVESNGHYKPFGNPNTPRDKEQGLFEHLAELRVRILWSFAWLGIGMVVAWHYGQQLQHWFSKPIIDVLKANDVPGAGENKIVFTDPMGGLQAYFSFSLVAGLILAMPAILYQIYKFVDPALTNVERKYSLVLVPFATILFTMGVALGYWCSPLFFRFFIIWAPEGTVQMWDYYSSITLMAKMLLCFGVCFEVPIIIIFLNKLGLVNRNILIEYWRHAVVVIFTVVAVITPTWDPLTMTICATPPCILYVLSIWLIKWL